MKFSFVELSCRILLKASDSSRSASSYLFVTRTVMRCWYLLFCVNCSKDLMIKTQCFNFNNIYSNNNESGPNCPVVNTEVFVYECLSGEVSYLEGSAHP
jgi:hypothetical protein